MAIFSGELRCSKSPALSVALGGCCEHGDEVVDSSGDFLGRLSDS